MVGSRFLAFNVAMLLLLAACAPAPPVKERLPTGMGPITFEQERLGWSELTLGLTREELAARLPGGVSVLRSEAPVCGEYFHHRQYQGREVSLQFSGPEPGATLQSIFIEVGEGVTRGELVSGLKQQIPGVEYEPSIHQPDLAEEENPTPLYLMPGQENLAVLIKPDSGIYLSLRNCLD